MNSRPITLDDRAAVEALRQKYGHETSSHAFASLFIWQKDMDLTLHLEEDLFAVRCRWRGENAWFFPCGAPGAVRDFVERTMQEPALCLCYLRREDVRFLEREFPGKFRVQEKPEDGEYLFDRREQAAFQGGQFARQRGDLHRLLRDHAVTWREVGPETMGDARAVCREWGKSHLEPSPDGLRGDCAGELLLGNWEALEARGVVGYVDGTPCSLAAGYPLSGRAFDQSLCRQSVRMTGLAAGSLQSLARILPEGFAVLNGEEDLGIDGLRLVKQRMRPSGFIEMFEGEHRNE